MKKSFPLMLMFLCLSVAAAIISSETRAQSGSSPMRVRWEYAQFAASDDPGGGCNLYLPPNGYEKNGQPVAYWYQKLGGPASRRAPGDRIFPIDVINLLGREGWELVSVHPHTGALAGNDYYFKRPTQ